MARSIYLVLDETADIELTVTFTVSVALLHVTDRIFIKSFIDLRMLVKNVVIMLWLNV